MNELIVDRLIAQSEMEFIDLPALSRLVELVVRDCASVVDNVYVQGGGTYGEKILDRYKLSPLI
jgi:hypothetical protein